MSKPKTRIEKGKQLENYVADQLREKLIDTKATRSIGSGSGTREKSDIDTSLMILGRNAGFECKNCKVAHIKDWWKQTQKLEVLRREPILVYKLGGESYGETKAVVYLDTLLELIKIASTIDTKDFNINDKQDNRNKLWALSNLKSAIKKLEKELK